jgi:hypothetical protein
MNIGRALGLTAWAAITAAWAIPTPGTVQKPSGFAQVATSKPAPDAMAKPADAIERAVQRALANLGPPNLTTTSGVEVDSLGEKMTAADLWAITTTSETRYLPPVEFSHPYRGRLILIDGASQETLHRLCPDLQGVMLGCAVKTPGELPTVAIADAATIRNSGLTYNLVALHEAGHLNGAGADHVGWRDGKTEIVRAAPMVQPSGMAEKPTVVADQGVAVEEEPDEPLPPPPRRHPRPRYHEPPVYGPPVYGPPPGWIVIPSEQRAMPCLPTLLSFGLVRFCI